MWNQVVSFVAFDTVKTNSQMLIWMTNIARKEKQILLKYTPVIEQAEERKKHKKKIYNCTQTNSETGKNKQNPKKLHLT